MSGPILVYFNFTGTDAHNTTHKFALDPVGPGIADAQCIWTSTGQWYSGDNDATFDGIPQNGTIYATDGSGARLNITKANYQQNLIVASPNGTAGITPNGNMFDPVSEATDELGAPTPTRSGTLSIIGLGTPFPADVPYTAKSPLTGTLTRSMWDGNINSLGHATYTYTWEYIPVCTGTTSNDFCGGMWVLGSLRLPDGSAYTFAYDQGTTASHYGVLTSITLPTGGQIGYSYSYPDPLAPVVASVTDNGGTTNISYSNSGSVKFGPGYFGSFYPITVTFPSHVTSAGGTSFVADQTVYSATTSTFVKKEYSGSVTAGNLLRTTTSTFDAYGRTTSVNSVWNATSESHEVDFKYADDSTLPNTMTYGSLGIDMVAQETEYSNGAPVRTLRTVYLQDTASIPYVSQYNMINYPVSVTLTDANGAVISEVQFTYDEYTASYCSPMLTPVSGAAGHDDADYGSSFYARGNPTTITYSGIGIPTTITTHRCYDTLGNVTQTIDGNGHPTQYSYKDSFYDSSCLSTNATYALPTSVTNPLGHQTATTYYSCNRAPSSIQGPNDLANARSGTSFTYDIQGRSLCTKTPDGGQSCNSYPSPAEIDVAKTIARDTSDIVPQLTDSYGNLTTVMDENASAQTDITYDMLGRTNTVSNAHFEASSPSDGKISYAYDALGRVASQLNQDGSTRTWSYNGNTVTVTDEVGRQSQAQYDSLGRLVKLLEPAASSSTPTLETDYGYDVLNNVTSVKQYGLKGTDVVRSRSFFYDGLSHLIAANNPENSATSKAASLTCSNAPANTVWNSCYSYDGNGNLQNKTDSRGVQTNYKYDALNRIVSKTYTNAPAGTMSSCYSYDSNPAASANGIGMLWFEWTQGGGCTNYSSPPSSGYQTISVFGAYDAVGRVVSEQQCTARYCTSPAVPSSPPPNCRFLSGGNGLEYCYDLAGDLLAYTNGAGASAVGNYSQAMLAFFQTFDSVGRLARVGSSWSDPTHPSFLFSQASYTAFNALSSWQLGAQLVEGRTYDNRLRVTGQSAAQ